MRSNGAAGGAGRWGACIVASLLAMTCTGVLQCSTPSFADDQSCQTTSGSGDGGKQDGGGGVGIGVNLDIGKVISFFQPMEEDPFKDPPKNCGDKDKDKKPPSGGGVQVGIGVGDGIIIERKNDDIIDIEDEPAHACHCQGGRLLVVMGNFTDPTIAAARNWAAGLMSGPMHANGHLHVLSFNAPPMSDPEFSFPYEPDATAPGGWKKLGHVVNDAKKDKTLPQDCCYFQEVMIMFHGHQAGSWSKLLQYLPSILNHKPVQRLVLWSCKSSKVFFPKSKKLAGEIYEKVCGVVAPKDCPCACAPARCNAYDADNAPTKCPTAALPVVVLAAGAFGGKATNLGINPENPGNPLTSPDGTMREITVTPGGGINAGMTKANPPAFGPNKVQTGGTAGAEGGEKFDPDVHLKDSNVIVIKPKLPYSGPKACPVKDGCFRGASPMPRRT